MNKLLISAYMALLYGVGLAGFETLVNWGQWQWWPFWLVDYVAAALLLFGGFKTCLLYTSPSPRDGLLSRMPSSA